MKFHFDAHLLFKKTWILQEIELFIQETQNFQVEHF